MSYLLIAAATLVSEDLTCIAAGVMVARGEIGYAPAALACLAGIFVGDLLLYLIGRFVGRPALSRAPLNWFVDDARVRAASDWFERRGAGVVFTARFLPGLRLPTYLAAGMLHTSLAAFTGWFLLAAALWTPLLVGGAAFLGDGFLSAVGALRVGGGIPAILTVLVLFAGLKVGIRLATRRGRRLLYSSWLRATHWEFWPPWIFYLPVAAWIARLGWKHRSLTLFTAANPAMPGGGFVGESKSDILADLARGGAPVARSILLRLESARYPGSGEAGFTVARGVVEGSAAGSGAAQSPWTDGAINTFQAGYDSLRRDEILQETAEALREPSQEEKVDRLLGEAAEFMQRKNLRFPMILKPDVGQRGSGVRIVRNEADLRGALLAARADQILQERVEGEEFGIFYIRRPGEARGWIFSITEKRLPKVTGDGRRTLEQLILDDPRAICMARYFLRQHAESLGTIPAPGEEVLLTEIGNHCRGALFLDGGHARTAALEESIDAIARRYDGFHFGRFDLRVTSRQELTAGRGFKILELNGVSSEATDIYDPRNSLFMAYRKLFAQWRLAFEIGSANSALGVAPTPLRELLIMMGSPAIPAATPAPPQADAPGAEPAWGEAAITK